MFLQKKLQPTEILVNSQMTACLSSTLRDFKKTKQNKKHDVYGNPVKNNYM